MVPALLLHLDAPSASAQHSAHDQDAAVKTQYREIGTTDVDAVCQTLAAEHNVAFSHPEPMLGEARLAQLSDGARIGVRAPLAEHDVPIVRPYMLVDDIEAAISKAEAAGAEFAMRTTEIPGHGKFAIYFLGGVQFGLWEL